MGLAAFRGEWQSERLEEVVGEAITALAQDIGAEGKLNLAVALVIGGRVTIAATGGAMGALLCKDMMAAGDVDNVDIIGNQDTPVVNCSALDDQHQGVILAAGAVRKAGIGCERLRAITRYHMAANRPKAACIAVLDQAKQGGAELPLVVVSVRLMWTQDETPAQKKLRLDSHKLTKVRCRHILMRHSASQAFQGSGQMAAKKVQQNGWRSRSPFIM